MKRLDEMTTREIIDLAERALLLSDAAGVYPTPLRDVAAFAGRVREFVDVSDIPTQLMAHKPRRLHRILGAIGFKSRTVFVDRSMGSARQHWTTGHEVGHALLPWHEAIAHFDDNARLFRESREEIETQANLAAAHLIFQGPRFVERARDYRLSITTPLALAEDMGASFHATLRYYVEQHSKPVALVVAGVYERTEGLPIWCTVESASFRARFGPISARFGRSLPLSGAGLPEGLQTAIKKSRTVGADAVASPVAIRDANGERVAVVAEAFSNGYTQFVMIAPKRIIKWGSRVRAA